MIVKILEEIQDLWQFGGLGKFAVIVGFIVLGTLAVLAFCGVFMPLLIAMIVIAAVFFGALERAIGALIVILGLKLIGAKVFFIARVMIDGVRVSSAWRNAPVEKLPTKTAWLANYLLNTLSTYDLLLLAFFVGYFVWYFSPIHIELHLSSSSSSSNSEKK